MLTPSTLQWVAASHDTRPADTLGAAVTPAQNAKGNWATVMAGGAVLHDVWEIEVRASNADITAVARNLFIDVGWDDGAGNFTVVIPNLFVSYAGPYLTSQALGIPYKFRVHFPAGKTIAARSSSSSANLTAFNVSVVVAGDPEDETLHWKGAFVRALGANEGSTSGVAFAPGQGADGAWAELGTLAEALHDWQLGIGADDSTITNLTYHFDLSIGAADPPTKPAIVNLKQNAATTEQWSRLHGFPGSAAGAVGEKAFARGWCSGAPDTNMTAIAYGTGGDGGNTAIGSGGSSEPVATTATTATVIRDALAQAIEDIVPGFLPTHEFKRYQGQLAFEDAMKQGPAHCFRKFSCRFDRESAVPITRNGVNQRWRYTFHIDVAYPEGHYQTADVPRLELDEYADDDQRLIQNAIWDIANATWIKSESADPTSETVDGVTYTKYVARFEFIRAMP